MNGRKTVLRSIFQVFQILFIMCEDEGLDLQRGDNDT